MTHEELVATPDYWTAKIQIDLFQKVKQYLKDNGLTQSDLAKSMGVSKGYISQVLKGDFDHRISKLVELCLAIGYYPEINFVEKEKEGEKDQPMDAGYPVAGKCRPSATR